MSDLTSHTRDDVGLPCDCAVPNPAVFDARLNRMPVARAGSGELPSVEADAPDPHVCLPLYGPNRTLCWCQPRSELTAALQVSVARLARTASVTVLADYRR
jgi:hypothetical protein